MWSAAVRGVEGYPVSVELDLSNGLPAYSTVGLPDSAVRESQELLNHARMVIKKSVEETTHGMNPINFDFVKSTLADDIGRFLFQKTAKKPIVIPVILGV